MRQLTLTVSAAAFDQLDAQAKARGTSPARLAAEALEREFHVAVPAAPPARRLEDRFGSIDLGAPTGTDNESIDRDLAEVYS